jgi:hypothetical protein
MVSRFSFFLKREIKLNLFFKNRNRFKPTGFSSVWFFRTKTGSTGLARFFRFGSIFSVLARFFPVLARFFRFGSIFFWFFRFGLGSVWFFPYKIETEPAGFFKNISVFFYGSVFSVFFLIFSV